MFILNNIFLNENTPHKVIWVPVPLGASRADPSEGRYLIASQLVQSRKKCPFLPLLRSKHLFGYSFREGLRLGVGLIALTSLTIKTHLALSAVNLRKRLITYSSIATRSVQFDAKLCLCGTYLSPVLIQFWFCSSFGSILISLP